MAGAESGSEEVEKRARLAFSFQRARAGRAIGVAG